MNLEAFMFADKLKSLLRRGDLALEARGYYRLTGGLAAEMVVAPVEIWVWEHGLLRKHPPRVFCKEPWMRDHVDWHNSARSGMCWVLEEQWHDEMGCKQLTPAQFLIEGPAWLLKAAGNLIDRHYVGHYKKLKSWPKEWEFYAHFGKGAKQYEREKRERRGCALR